MIRRGMAQASLDYLKAHPDKVEGCDNRLLTNMIKHWEAQTSDSSSKPLFSKVSAVYLEVLSAQREYLFRLNRQRKDIDEDVIRRFIHRIDLEEERIKSE